LKLIARGVSARHGAREAVRDVSLAVHPGELWAVLGPNGAGKSTLLRALLGLHAPSAGEVLLDERPLPQWRRSELARVLAWVPQSSDPGLSFTGLELVLLGRSPHLGLWGLPSAADVALARAALEELEISDLAARPADQLSGGERRLLLLARALAQQPRVLLLDEPTAFLDLKHQVTALQRLRARVDGGLAAVAVLHDVNLAAAYADHVLLLREGRAVDSGRTADVLQASALESLYGLPMATAAGPGGQPLFAPRRAP
jgi:iron complex transport system ATP-binding protein